MKNYMREQWTEKVDAAKKAMDDYTSDKVADFT
jgi:hypothetical protein